MKCIFDSTHSFTARSTPIRLVLVLINSCSANLSSLPAIVKVSSCASEQDSRLTADAKSFSPISNRCRFDILSSSIVIGFFR